MTVTTVTTACPGCDQGTALTSVTTVTTPLHKGGHAHGHARALQRTGPIPATQVLRRQDRPSLLQPLSQLLTGHPNRICQVLIALPDHPLAVLRVDGLPALQKLRVVQRLVGPSTQQALNLPSHSEVQVAQPSLLFSRTHGGLPTRVGCQVPAGTSFPGRRARVRARGVGCQAPAPPFPPCDHSAVGAGHSSVIGYLNRCMQVTP